MASSALVATQPREQGSRRQGTSSRLLRTEGRGVQTLEARMWGLSGLVTAASLFISSVTRGSMTSSFLLCVSFHRRMIGTEELGTAPGSLQAAK